MRTKWTSCGAATNKNLSKGFCCSGMLQRLCFLVHRFSRLPWIQNLESSRPRVEMSASVNYFLAALLQLCPLGRRYTWVTTGILPFLLFLFYLIFPVFIFSEIRNYATIFLICYDLYQATSLVCILNDVSFVSGEEKGRADSSAITAQSGQ